jgi:hypothetical protein
MANPAILAFDQNDLRSNVVRVTIPAKAAFDLKQMHKITESVLDKLGCANCHSGHDIRFDLEREFIVDAKLNVIGRSELIKG